MLILGDCIEVMGKLDNGSFDLVLTDPPYNASNTGVGLKGKYHTVLEDWDMDFKIDFFDVCWNKLKDDGQMIIFCSHHLLNTYLNKKEPMQILHWHKTNPFPAMTERYGYSVEYILWYCKSNKYTFNKNKRYSYKDLFSTKIAIYKQTEHPTEKPYGMIESLVLTHSNEDDNVLDPFSGSGTTLVACMQTRRDCCAIEIKKEYYDMTLKRIQIHKENPSLF